MTIVDWVLAFMLYHIIAQTNQHKFSRVISKARLGRDLRCECFVENSDIGVLELGTSKNIRQ